jgi:glyoxylase-like metal-dependent hydrolase (beta-lactamase superfamily II)
MQAATAPKYNTDFNPVADKIEAIRPGVKRLVASNSSAYTFTGTNTYIVGFDEVVIIDPGPDKQTHMDAIVKSLGDARCKGIVLTHTHRDHSALAPKLAEHLQVPLIFEGTHRPSRTLKWWERDPLKSSGHYGLKPDLAVKTGSKIDLGEISLTVLETPGHCANHIALILDDTDCIFTGDHVMGWSSTLIADPDGSLSSYFKSLERLIDCDQSTYFPAHGDVIKEGRLYARQLFKHREYRNTQIMGFLEEKPRWTGELLKALYPDIPLTVKPAALLTLNAHLQYLIEQGEVGFSQFLLARKFHKLSKN